MTLMPKGEKAWGPVDVLEWLLILAAICFLMALYYLARSRIKRWLQRSDGDPRGTDKT